MFLFCLVKEQVLLQKDEFKEKRNMKSTAMLPPRNDQIKNQYSTMIITKKDPILQQLLPKGLTGHKPLIDGKHFSDPTENLHYYSTDNSCTDNEYSMKKIECIKG